LPIPGMPLRVEIPMIALIEEKLDAWEPVDCPLCQAGVPINISLGHGAALLENRA